MLDVGVIGGGPGGLFLARLLLMRGIAARVRVCERNPLGATFGFGIVFSDRTMSALRAADPETHDRIVAASRSWRDMEVRIGGREIRYGGYGFTAIARRVLLDILREQAEASGAQLDFLTVADAAELCSEHQLVVAADGVGSETRDARKEIFGTEIEQGSAKFIWYGTTAPMERVTFPFVKTVFGVFAAHTYRGPALRAVALRVRRPPPPGSLASPRARHQLPQPCQLALAVGTRWRTRSAGAAPSCGSAGQATDNGGMRNAFDPDELPSHAFYGLLTVLVVPRPIAWVSTIGADGVDNLAPAKF
ncbi:FAD-dependent monooxygenase [Streptomyces sp. NPDC005251]|uniref:FAD-dependent monooxygenase n=1 Tax=Streptomyces sp. NPDC005251 TaxID=3157166 RepID=UPI0033B19408